MELNKLQEMIQPKAAMPDNTRQEAWQVFTDKSQEADTMKINASNILKSQGLTEQDILDIVMGMSGAPSGAGILKSLKGLGGGLKGLIGKIGSKAKFPRGYVAPQPSRSPIETPAFARKAVNERMSPREQIQNEQQVRTIIQESIDQLMKPNTVVKKEGVQKALKGMRKVGIRG